MFPENDEYPGYYEPFIRLSSPGEMISVLKETGDQILEFISSIPNEKADFKYETDKWSVKEVLIHIIDTERIYSYRALRFARNDKTELPGFDENHFGLHCNAAQRTLKDLLEEFSIVRKSTIALYQSFDQENLLKSGIANEKRMTVRAIGHIMAGHALHHCNIIRERYLN